MARLAVVHTHLGHCPQSYLPAFGQYKSGQLWIRGGELDFAVGQGQISGVDIGAVGDRPLGNCVIVGISVVVLCAIMCLRLHAALSGRWEVVNDGDLVVEINRLANRSTLWNGPTQRAAYPRGGRQAPRHGGPAGVGVGPSPPAAALRHAGRDHNQATMCRVDTSRATASSSGRGTVGACSATRERPCEDHSRDPTRG
jgi:hypothetical protein